MTALARCALAALVSALPLGADGAACKTGMPCYATASVVNSASYATGWLAPNTFASIFGWNLADATVSSSPGSQDPTGAIGGVRVLVNAEPAYVSYVSPYQVNFVIPTDLTGSTATVQLVHDSLAGPAVTLTVHDSAPALFVELDAVTAIALHGDWSLVTAQTPARAGGLVVLFATGLGPYQTPVLDFNRPPAQDWIARAAEFKVLLNGLAVDSSLVYFVGASPVSVGVFQINLQLPAWVGPNPEIRIALGDRVSPPGTRLPVQ